MAPKKKPAPPPPPPPSGGIVPLPVPVPHFKAVPPEVKWRVIRLFGIFCFLVFIVVTVLYIKMRLNPVHPLNQPMYNLKSSLTNSLRKPSIFRGNYLLTAEELIQLPENMVQFEKSYNEMKSTYQSIFKKGAVRSSTGWTLFEKNLYYVSKGRKTWYDAQNFCLSRDAHMTSILTGKEQKFVSSLLNDSAWIGLTDAKDKGSWKWSDGSRLTIQYWNPGSPTVVHLNGDVERDCAYISPSSGRRNWKDDNCHELKKWVCKEVLVAEESVYLSKPQYLE